MTCVDERARRERRIPLRTAVPARWRKVVMVDKKRVVAKERENLLLVEERLQRAVVLEVKIHAQSVLAILEGGV